MKCLLIRYNEIALKGHNSDWFQDVLAKNIRYILNREFKKIGIQVKYTLEKRRHRLILFLKDLNNFNSNENKSIFHFIQQSLIQIFGISSIVEIQIIPSQLIEIQNRSEILIYDTIENSSSFAIRVTKREKKVIDLPSQDIEAKIGAKIKLINPSLKVQLKSPEYTLHIEITKKETFLWIEQKTDTLTLQQTTPLKGLNGLPTGTGGHLLALLSGGIDSPVAALQMMKRGASISFIHFHGTPFVGNEILQKVTALYHQCVRYHPFPKALYIIPFGKIQEEIAKQTPSQFRTILYRRMMFRIASFLARKINAKALVTGESLGQVASQTIDNLKVIEESSRYPILRPLISFDKSEVIQLAKTIGTYEISIQPAIDCCTLFVEQSPELYSKIEIILEIEKKLPIEEIAFKAYKCAKKIKPY